MSTYLDLFHIDPTTPAGWAEVEALLGAEGIKASIIDWVGDHIRKTRDLQHELFETIDAKNNFHAEIEELQDMVAAYQKKFGQIEKALAA